MSFTKKFIQNVSRNVSIYGSRETQNAEYNLQNTLSTSSPTVNALVRELFNCYE